MMGWRKFLVHQQGLSDDQLDIAGLARDFSVPLFPGPLASRRGDRIISEAFALFLPPSPPSPLSQSAR